MRQQPDSKIVYKALRCLTKFVENKNLAQVFMGKGGPSSTVNLFQNYQQDLKNIFQALKLIGNLVKKYPERYEDFVFAGIPEKIVQNYDQQWPIEIQKKILDLFARMAMKNENVKDILGSHFLDQLIPLMNTYISNQSLVRNGVILLAICSNSVSSVDSIYHSKGNTLADRLLKDFITSEKILLNDLVLMENMILMNDNSKEEYLKMKTDDAVEKIYKSTSPTEQKEINGQAKKVLDLLRSKKESPLEVAQGA